MTAYARGTTATLSVEWREYAPNGPLAPVTDVEITITPLTGGAAVVGPTGAGILNPAVGIYVYNWAVPDALDLGNYVVLWTGSDTEVTGLSASEIISITATADSASTSGPCESWPVIWPCVLETSAVAVSGTALAMATEVLWAMTGRRYGHCTYTTRPCKRNCYDSEWWSLNPWSSYNAYPIPVLYAGRWFNITCGTCQGECSCATLSEVMLPGPVSNVSEVKVDGVPLVKNVDYRVDNWRILVRLGAEWPMCNNLNLADTEVGTWSVTFTVGETVPMMGQVAVGVLAEQFIKALLCDDSCELPATVQSIARQGVNVTFLDPSAVFENGQTGLYLPDLFIRTVNPNRRQQRARVYDLDNLGARRQLGTS
jgi:hypothetical protein